MCCRMAMGQHGSSTRAGKAIGPRGRRREGEGRGPGAVRRTDGMAGEGRSGGLTVPKGGVPAVLLVRLLTWHFRMPARCCRLLHRRAVIGPVPAAGGGVVPWDCKKKFHISALIQVLSRVGTPDPIVASIVLLSL